MENAKFSAQAKIHKCRHSAKALEIENGQRIELKFQMSCKIRDNAKMKIGESFALPAPRVGGVPWHKEHPHTQIRQNRVTTAGVKRIVV